VPRVGSTLTGRASVRPLLFGPAWSMSVLGCGERLVPARDLRALAG
jgi:hypothetical protein